MSKKGSYVSNTCTNWMSHGEKRKLLVMVKWLKTQKDEKEDTVDIVPTIKWEFSSQDKKSATTWKSKTLKKKESQAQGNNC